MRRLLLPLVLLALAGCSSVGVEPSASIQQALEVTSHRPGEETAEAYIVVSGTAPAGARIVRDISFGPDDESIAGADGHWEIEVELEPGNNELTFRIGDDESTAVSLVLSYDPDLADAESPPPATPSSSPSFGPTGPTEVAMVVKVVDGDTIRVEIDGTEYPVRYIGIDSPEPDADDERVRDLADDATAANSALVAGREVILERDVSDTDQFDRLLRNVWIEEDGVLRLVGLELVRQGFAQASTYPPDVKYADQLLSIEQGARDAEAGLWAPEPTPTPSPTPLAFVSDEPLSISSESRESFSGAAGRYTWESLSFVDERATVRWNVSAAQKSNCRVSWRLTPDGGEDDIHSTVRVDAGDTEKSNRRYDTPFYGAEFVVNSTCPDWAMSLQGYTPPPADDGSGGGNCDSSYPGTCIPAYPPDLDCGEITERNFDVVGSDPHGFDGDNDGIGCET